MPSIRQAPFDRKSPTLGPLPSWDVHPSVIAARDRESPITEQYRAVRTWLLRRSGSTEHNCLAITSTIPREGKSVTTANLAAVLSEIRHLKILAVDADFRQGRLATLLKTPNSPGLADVIAGRATLDQAIRTTPLPNLLVLPAGAYQDLNPA
jgi:tyrosine-protein kinase Etk/Wzc